VQSATISSISDAHSSPTEAQELGDQITQLCSHIYAAEARLLTLIREFDDKECWAGQGRAFAPVPTGLTSNAESA